MVIPLCINLNIHFGNQFSSRKRWVPISRHSFQVRCPSLGRRCTKTILSDSHNIHLGNQFSSRKRWVPTSRHAFQVHCPSFGMCCMMTTVTTYIWGTNSHLKNGGFPISRASLHGQALIFNRKSIRHLSLSSSEG